VDIGDAHRLGLLDDRIVEILVAAATVTVVGAHPVAVGETVRYLRAALGRWAA
jgi:hypothetical protein